ncbi:MAG: hypothetical protein PQJ59_11590 [Spirochaetales bacterium]|nr:hypothetical protein [Spirochaetales bacterium]
MKRNLKVWKLLCALVLASAVFLNSCDDATSSSSSSSASISVTSVSTSGTVEAAQDSDEVTVTVVVSEANGGNVDTVTVSGDSLSSDVSLTEGSDSWTGTITPDASSSAEDAELSFTVTATDNTSVLTATTTFTVTVGAEAEAATDQGAYVSGFITSDDNESAQGGEAWFDITITDASALGDEWYIMYSTYYYFNTALSSSNVEATLSDGDVIRIHTAYSSAETFDSTSMSDDDFGNSTIWDFEAESSYVNDGDTYGMFYIVVGDGDTSTDETNMDYEYNSTVYADETTYADYVISVIPFYDNASDEGYWFSGDVDTLFDCMVEAGLWDSTEYSDAVQIDGDYDVCSTDSLATSADDISIETHEAEEVEQVTAGAAYVSQFITSSSHTNADGGEAWFDVTLSDVSELGDEWYIVYANYSYFNTTLSSSNLSATFADGDVIRIHTQGSTAENFDTDSMDGDDFGNSTIWDFESENSYANDGDSYGMFYIVIGDGDTDTDESDDKTAAYVTSVIPFYDSTTDAGYWFSSDVATLYDNMVTAGLWTSTDTSSGDDAVQIDGDTSLCSATAAVTSADDVTITTVEQEVAEQVTAGAAYVSQFITCQDNSMAQNAEAWIDVTISDIDSLGDEWYVMYGYSGYMNLAFSSTSLDSSVSLSNGDVIRIHGTDWVNTNTYDTTSIDGDSFGNDTVWDFVVENSYAIDGDDAYGMFYILIGDGDTSDTSETSDDSAAYVTSVMPYSDSVDNSGSWFYDYSYNTLTLYENMVTAGLWTSTDTSTGDDAVQIDGDNDYATATSAATSADDVTVTTITTTE